MELATPINVYYNENDPKAIAWLRCLMEFGAIPRGDLDTRSIMDVVPSDIIDYDQCHFFTGIGGWPEAFKLSGWGNKKAWTGSCPCQPFSIAGEEKGALDERHLWPAWFHLIEQCRPPVVFGEQVANAATFGWADLVQDDMEAAGYALGFVNLPASGVGCKFPRERLFFVADTGGPYVEGSESEGQSLCQFQTQAPAQYGDGSLHEGFHILPTAESISPAHGLSRPVGIVRGFGNAIVPQVAAQLIKAYMAIKGM